LFALGLFVETKTLNSKASSPSKVHFKNSCYKSASSARRELVEFKEQIHQEALVVAKNYKRSEIELIEILQKVDAHQVHYKYECQSLKEYAIKKLELSEDVALLFINVSRKARKIPQLKEEIKCGRITVTKARRIGAVMNEQNQEHWLELARTVSKYELEKQIALAQPEKAIREQMSFVPTHKEIKEKVKVKTFEGSQKSSC
jgi:hypothetical protein